MIPSYITKAWQRYKWELLLLAGLVSAAYAGTLHAEFVADDIQSVVTNTSLHNVSLILQHPAGVIWAIVRYLNMTTGGIDPVQYHLTNILFHLINVFLVYVLCRLCFHKSAAFMTAALFAVHPLGTESVTWVSGGIYTFLTTLLLLSFIAYILSKRFSNNFLYIASLLFFVCSIFTSEKSIILIPILALYMGIKKQPHKEWKDIIPFLLGGILLVWIYLPFVSGRVGSYQKEFALNSEVSNMYLLSFVAFAKYIRLYFFPFGLTLYHVEPLSGIDYILSFIICFLYIAGLVISYRRNKNIFYWLSFFGISLLPVILPLKIASFVAERYVYIGSIGLSYITAEFLNRLEKYGMSRKYIAFISCIIIAIFLFITLQRNNEWSTPKAFWVSTAAVSPHSYQAHYNLGMIYLEEKDLDAAIREFVASVTLKSNYDIAYQSLGYAYQLHNMQDEALASYIIAVSLNPSFWPSYKNMGAIYLELKDYDKAETMAKKAIAIDKRNPDLYTNLGIIYLREGKKDAARKAFHNALSVEPRYKKAIYGLSITK